MNRIEIREATADDALAIADAHSSAWEVAYRGVVPDSVLDDPAMREARIAGWTRRLNEGPPVGAGDPDNRVFAGLVDRRVVGFGHAGREAPREGSEHRGEIYGFYLHPDAWGSGAGAALMEVCLAELRGRFETAVLWVLRDNPRARRFYEKTGWSTTGEAIQFEGAIMPGVPPLPEPLDEVQYRIEL